MTQIVYEKNCIMMAAKKLNEITVTGIENAENLVLVAKLLDTGTEMESEDKGDKANNVIKEETENGER